MGGKVREPIVDVGHEDREVDAGPARLGDRSLDQPGPGAGQVLDDARRVATDVVDVCRGELDEALEERPLAGIVGAHPGRLEQLVGLEEVAPVVGVEPFVERGGSRVGRQRSVGLRAPGRVDDGQPLGHQTSSLSGWRLSKPVSIGCQKPTRLLAELPAQPDLPAVDEGREVDEAVGDVAQGDAHRLDPGDARGHLVDQALHPQAGQAQLVGGDRGLGGAGRLRRLAARLVAACAGPSGEHLVAQADQLRALRGQRRQDLIELRHGGVRVVDIVEAGHGRQF